ncbi:hypothetical protein [Comamonas kerstersii]|uniref:hypothetical protein n=1 Tax=Comamonas kerstersii TaxID=225992 RepID=UPI0026DD8E27|nr:hypothetical protein [Comamonas kerstersii]
METRQAFLLLPSTQTIAACAGSKPLSDRKHSENGFSPAPGASLFKTTGTKKPARNRFFLAKSFAA